MGIIRLTPKSISCAATLAVSFLIGLVASPVLAGEACCNVIELRQYTVHAGQREALIDLFDHTFADPLDATGMTVIGQFRDLDRPDRFVWIRGFPSMESRPQELAAFYDSALWRARRADANALIEDSDNVLLLEPAGRALGFKDVPARPAAESARSDHEGLVVATLFYTRPGKLPTFETLFTRTLKARAQAAGARTLAAYVTSDQANNFPRLTIRTGEHILVWVAHFASAKAYSAYRARLDADQKWTQTLWPSARAQLIRDPEILRLTPTPRSRLRG